MTAREIAARLTESAKGISLLRVQKAQALAQRSGVAWADVLAALSDEQRATVEQARD